MNRNTLLAAVTTIALANPALAQNGGRPPRPGTTPTAPAQPAGQPSGAPIKIVRPAGQQPGAPVTIGQPAGQKSGNSGGRPATVITKGPSAAEQMLSSPFGLQVFQWKNPSPPVLLPRAATHVCTLTSVSGKLVGFSERVALYVDGGASGGPRWVLNATSKQSELSATATCVEKARFVSPSPIVAASYGAHAADSCAPRTTGMPVGDNNRAFFIAGIAGKFMGGGESVTVTRGPGGRGFIRVTACSGGVDGTLLSIGSGAPAKFRTMSGISTNAGLATVSVGASVGESSLFDGGGPIGGYNDGDAQWLVPADEALCGLVMIKGKLQGYGENARVYIQKGEDGRNWWRLSVYSQAQGASIGAAARCIARDQR